VGLTAYIDEKNEYTQAVNCLVIALVSCQVSLPTHYKDNSIRIDLAAALLKSIFN